MRLGKKLTIEERARRQRINIRIFKVVSVLFALMGILFIALGLYGASIVLFLVAAFLGMAWFKGNIRPVTENPETFREAMARAKATNTARREEQKRQRSDE